MGFSSIALAALALGAAAQNTAGAYGQCKLNLEDQCARDWVTDFSEGGGIGYTGPSACGSGYTCTTYK